MNAGISHQQAIGILQSATGLIRLVVARTPSPPAGGQHQNTSYNDVTSRSDVSTDKELAGIRLRCPPPPVTDAPDMVVSIRP